MSLSAVIFDDKFHAPLPLLPQSELGNQVWLMKSKDKGKMKVREARVP